MASIRTKNLTPHFRNLLREENPLWETHEFYHWQWSVDGPLYDGKLLSTKEIDSRHPGGTAIGRMFADIQRGVAQLTFTTHFVP